MKKSYYILGGLALMLAVFIFLQGRVLDRLPDFQRTASEFFLEHIRQEVFAPDPLFGPREQKGVVLTRIGVIAWTNRQRLNNHLQTLNEDTILNEIAQSKAKDMIDRQYFAHESPTGDSAGDLANHAGYEYIIIGENLALGNYDDDQALVEAWMDSPGHRENILKGQFTAIGVGLAEGEFEEQNTWLAVQVFAKPKSDCPEPNGQWKSSIEDKQKRLDEMKVELEQERAYLETSEAKKNPEYNAKVDKYNQLVQNYNQLIAETKDLIARYNSEVRQFNECAEQ